MSTQITIKGRIKSILPTQYFGANNFAKRDIIIETELDTKYPQVIKLEAIKDNTSLFDNLTEGQEATFHINLKGREWTNSQGETQVFNSIVVWKVSDVDSKVTPAPQPQSTPEPKPNPISGAETQDVAYDDDLPF